MGGLKFGIHPLFILLGLIVTALGQAYYFLAYLIAVIIHEMGHSAVAERYGYVLDEIRLMPYGAVLNGNIEGIKAQDEVKIALAGPVVNIITALIFTAVWWLAPRLIFLPRLSFTPTRR